MKKWIPQNLNKFEVSTNKSGYGDLSLEPSVFAGKAEKDLTIESGSLAEFNLEHLLHRIQDECTNQSHPQPNIPLSEESTNSEIDLHLKLDQIL